MVKFSTFLCFLFVIKNRSQRDKRGTTPRSEVITAYRNGLSAGFTIVELLIVVVVIAILATITIVSYNGIAAGATEASIKSDLRNAATALGVDFSETGAYPALKGSVNGGQGLKTSDGNTLSYTASDNEFCVSVSNPKLSTSFQITQAGYIEEGDCGKDTIVANAPIQSVTQAQCEALPVFTGANDEALRVVKDERGGTARTYEIAKLADNKCWMLTNLKLGSTAGSITLTPEDSNVVSNFVLPRLNDGTRSVITSGPGNDYETPYIYGPVPGDSGSGVSNFGYLYNTSAAMAGGNGNSLGNSNSAYSICPSGWRLPTGRNTTGDFAYLNARMNNPAASTGSTVSDTGYYQNWLYGGAFKSVASGRWYNGFQDQNYIGTSILWTGSSYVSGGNYNNSFMFRSSSTQVLPGNSYVPRPNGHAVRCILN